MLVFYFLRKKTFPLFSHSKNCGVALCSGLYAVSHRQFWSSDCVLRGLREQTNLCSASGHTTPQLPYECEQSTVHTTATHTNVILNLTTLQQVTDLRFSV